jgi:RecB family exonuclease
VIDRLAGYIAGVAADEVRTEQAIKLQIGRALLSGSADRLHITGDGARVVDLKTGKTAVTAAEAEDHAQLAMYQLAADLGAFEGIARATGAELVYVGTDAKGAAIREQLPVDAEATRARLDQAVETMASARFHATAGDHCRHCPVRRSCPVQPEGVQVTARWSAGEESR